MTQPARTFIDRWIAQNVVASSRPEGDRNEAILKAQELIIAARRVDISKEELEAEVGDLVDYVAGAIDSAVVSAVGEEDPGS